MDCRGKVLRAININILFVLGIYQAKFSAYVNWRNCISNIPVFRDFYCPDIA
jgi:hypothetical protein